MSDEKKCPECAGQTIQFAGARLDMRYRICSKWRESGHLSEQELRGRLAEVRAALRPSGRFA